MLKIEKSIVKFIQVKFILSALTGVGFGLACVAFDVSFPSPISFHSADVIVELGAGNGVFTKEIIKRMKSSCKLFVFETNELFFELLSKDMR